MCLVVTAGKWLTSSLSFVVSSFEFVTVPLVFWVRCGTWLYQYLIFAPLLTLHGHIQANVPSAKYLGVTLTQDLKWDIHIQNICVKANQTKRRNPSIGPVSIKQQAYFSLVCPLIEYFSSVWDPKLRKNIKKLEMVKRMAARYVLHRHHNTSSVTDMFKTLNWRSLKNRRKDMRFAWS